MERNDHIEVYSHGSLVYSGDDISEALSKVDMQVEAQYTARKMWLAAKAQNAMKVQNAIKPKGQLK
jgi:hypothetical protein